MSHTHASQKYFIYSTYDCSPCSYFNNCFNLHYTPISYIFTCLYTMFSTQRDDDNKADDAMMESKDRALEPMDDGTESKADTGGASGRGGGAQASDVPIGARPSLIYGTVNGVIGVVATLSADEFKFLQRMQRAMNEVVKSGIGGLSHQEWRAFGSDRQPLEPSARSKHFIDGDLIESFLDLPVEQMEAVVGQMNEDGDGAGNAGITDTGDSTVVVPASVTVDALTRKVEELTRLH